jgi:hypothetical protein
MSRSERSVEVGFPGASTALASRRIIAPNQILCHNLRIVGAPRVFISHTDSDETQRRATTAIVIELRRVGLDVWVDRENPPPTGPEDYAVGPIPENPLFHYILDALTSSDALIYVISPKSFDREYVRLEFDPRMLFQHFARAHSSIPVEKLPIFIALVEPLAHPSSLWTYLVDGPIAGRILNMTGAASTPLILPTVLMTMIKEIAPDHVFPLSPIAEWTIRQGVEAKATGAPGCPQGISAQTWLGFENLFGLGPLFPVPLASLTEQDLRYGVYRLGDSARILPPKVNVPPRSLAGMEWRLSQIVSPYIALWTANAMLRSKEVRFQAGIDLSVEHNLPYVIRAFSEENNRAGIMCATLQYGCALLTSPNLAVPDNLPKFIEQSHEYFRSIGASPLVILSEILLRRATSTSLSKSAEAALKDLGLDPHDSDLLRLYHGYLEAAFPGPRLESTDAYRAEVNAYMAHARKAASTMTAKFGRAGAEQFNEEF